MIYLFQLLCIPLSVVYLLIISIRDICYSFKILKIYRLPGRVISIGNITWGGTGKTPFTAFVAEALKKKNYNPGILIRGYGREEERILSELKMPVLIDRDRLRAGNEAISKYFVDTVILDDGFQYRRLHRDLDIVCIDGTSPFGNGFLIPAGPLREPLIALKRADIFVITKVDLIRDKERLKKLEYRLKSINPYSIIVKAIHRPLYFYRISDESKINIGELKDRNIVLLSGIGNPSSFKKTILRLGLKIDRHFIFWDHHPYTQKDINGIRSYCRRHSFSIVITTEKDAVKLKILNLGKGIEFLVLKVRVEIVENEEGFYNRLFGIYRG